MSIFSNGKRYVNAEKAQKNQRTMLTIIFTLIVVIIFALAITLTLSSDETEKPKETLPEPTRFVEQETEMVKKGEEITINDPALGKIKIDAVAGFPKNTYINDNFKLDSNGRMTYYTDKNEVASCMGVDLSEYQGVVDFYKLREQGFDFVILRIGGRYYGEEGAMYVDTNYHNYYKLAKEAGLHVGGYFFSQAKNAEEGAQEAEFVLDLIRGMDFDYPIAFDWEIIEDDKARTDDVSGEDLTNAALAFCDIIKENGFHPIIYSNTNLMYYKYDLERLKDVDFWVADYEKHPSMYYHFTMWQYAIDGQVEGINGNVDMNICLKNY